MATFIPFDLDNQKGMVDFWGAQLHGMALHHSNGLDITLRPPGAEH
jgi:hypothetical protein